MIRYAIVCPCGVWPLTLYVGPSIGKCVLNMLVCKFDKMENFLLSILPFKYILMFAIDTYYYRSI